jgi:putative iron-regulated protein
MKHRISLCILVVLSTTLGLVSCDSEDDPVDSRQEIVNAVAENVIVAIYHDLNDEGAALLTAIEALKNDPTSSAKLDAARAAWRATRKPFEMGEAFEFGPLEDNHIKDDVDTWPLDIPALDSILSSSFVLNEANVKVLDPNVRGFHMMEYFLWGDAENSVAPKLGARELEFLYLMTKVTVAKFTELHEAWENSYLQSFKERPVVDALLELAKGINHIADELGEEYLALPVNDPGGPREWAESFYSNSSTLDFTDIMSGVEAVYLGDYGSTTDGKGLTDFVKEQRETLDDSVKTQIQTAITAIQSIGPDFNTAAKNKDPKITTAIDACEKLHRTLEDYVFPLIK